MTDICNLGGFISLSTLDWPGRSTSVIFLRGCPNRCPDCHNKHLAQEGPTVPMTEVFELLQLSVPFVGGVVVSGGEPTKRLEELTRILEYAHDIGLQTRVQTSGIYPANIEKLIDRQLVDSIALDFKVELGRIDTILPKNIPYSAVPQTLKICEIARASGTLDDFEVVHTIFPYYGHDRQLSHISNYVDRKTKFILNQGQPLNPVHLPLDHDRLCELTSTFVRQPLRYVRSKDKGQVFVKNV